MGDGQITLSAVSGYDNDEVESREKEIKDIINKIIDKNDMTEMRRFADYRNYMSYEIIMLDFFKNQDFQVIFCAPPNKLESIGNECGVIIPVLKISNDNMQIGKVKFHEQ